MAAGIRAGDRAPDFTLRTQEGKTVSLHDFLGLKDVILYFYPKDFTAGCAAETREFGVNYDRIAMMGAEVVGISSDSVESHRGFAEECSAGFLLVSDEGGKVRERYGVRQSLGLIPGRTTFVIDKEGVVRHVFSSQLNPKKHVSEAIGALERLRGS